MISHRQADLLDRIKKQSDPVGKLYIMVPSIGAREKQKHEVITRADLTSGSMTVRKANGEIFTRTFHEFLGCRDGMAFFANSNGYPYIGKYLFIESEEGAAGYPIEDSQGKITSMDFGIFKTDKGKSFPLEKYGYVHISADKVVI